ncbi:hypothetical protein FHL15_007031 [Xylaria flabelliformis]|uniref:Uncharacterized protein n=1 Tax=Xylaria flabelliformis TaxID=2512241 RepID=A0A553HW29_9PEZI|nr:hypothetical protein FHL15_007031 [Xylaria flabelliformis]
MQYLTVQSVINEGENLVEDTISDSRTQGLPQYTNLKRTFYNWRLILSKLSGRPMLLKNYVATYQVYVSVLKSGTSSEDWHVAKSELTWVVEHERRGLDIALAVLSEQLPTKNRDTMSNGQEFFINVTDLFRQIYVVRDIGHG